MEVKRVCVIGAHKSGTSSVTDWLEKTLKTKWIYVNGKWRLNPKNVDNAIDWVETTNQTIIRDSPFNHLDVYKQLDVRFPDAKFILTIRPSQSWYSSVQKWCKTIPAALPYYKYLYGYPKASKEHVIELYERRNHEIIEYFKGRKDKLIVIKLWESTSSEQLSRFLGVDSAWKVFSHLNKSTNTKKGNTNKK